MQRFATDHIGAGIVPGTWPPAVGTGPCPRASPTHWAMLSTSHVETGLGKSWAPSRQQTSFPRRCQSASEEGAWEPGHGVYASCMAAEGGWAAATALGAPGRQAGRGTLSRPEAASLPWSCCVLCALLGSRTLARRRGPTRGYCVWGSRRLGGCQCGAARLRQRQVGWEGWGEAGRLWHPRGTGTPVS